MADFDALFSALKAEVDTLKARFVDEFLPANPEHTPSDFEHNVKAFSVLTHAAFEEFVEAISESMMRKVETDLLTRKTSLATACFLSAYGIKLDLSEEDEDSDKTCFDHIRIAINEAKSLHSNVVRLNNGVSKKYIRKLLIPVGINMPTGPSMDSLRKLTEARGSFAHTMAKLAHYGEYKRATKVLTPEEAWAAASDCLDICDGIRERAKAVW